MAEFHDYPTAGSLAGGDLLVVERDPAGTPATEALSASLLAGWVAQGGTIRRPDEFGAAGDGSTDDTDDLNAWLAAAGPGVALVAEPGAVYAHSGTLTMTGKADTRLVLAGAALSGTAQATSALKLVACQRVKLLGGRLGLASPPSSRGSTEDHHRLYAQGCDGLAVAGVHVTASHAAGMLLLDCHDFTVEDTVTEGTRADGLHMTGGSSRGVVRRHRSIGCGDDGIAIVSYTDTDPDTLCRSITVYDGQVWGQPGGAELADAGGRGMTIVGGHDCHFVGGEVWRSWGAGLLFAIEPAFTSHPVTDCSASGVRLVACSRSDGLDHGSVLVSSARDGMAIAGVVLAALDIVDAGLSGLAASAVQVKASGTTGTVSGIVVGRPGAPVRLSGIYDGDLHVDGGLAVASQQLELVPPPVVTVHAGSASEPRPRTRGAVYWISSTDPENRETSDLWHQGA